MTTYSAITDAEIEVGKPISNNLLTKFRNNPLAIQEGDATAPPIAIAALASDIASSAILPSLGGNFTDTSWATLGSAYIYIPAWAQTMEYKAQFKRITGSTGTVYGRLTHSAHNGSALTITNPGTSSSWASGTGSLDVADESGWVLINLQVYLVTLTEANISNLCTAFLR